MVKQLVFENDAREAILRGYSTLFASATSIVTQLVRAHTEGRLEERLTHLAKPKLLVIDELGYLPFEANAAHLFFQLVSRRYERGATLVTSNRSVAEWGGVFGDAVVHLPERGLELLPDKYCTDPAALRISLAGVPAFERAVFAHGQPLLTGASAKVAALL